MFIVWFLTCSLVTEEAFDVAKLISMLELST